MTYYYLEVYDLPKTRVSMTDNSYARALVTQIVVLFFQSFRPQYHCEIIFKGNMITYC